MQVEPYTINQQIPQTLSSQVSLIEKIQNLLTHNTPQCPFSNKAIYTCINKNCLHPSPFVCTLQQCQCSQSHQLCPQIKLKSFEKIFNKKQKIKDQIQEKINNRTDNLIDEISDLRQRMIQNIRQGHGQQIFGDFNDKKFTENFESLKELKESHLTGQIMSSIYESDQKLESSNKIQKIMEKIEKIFDNVKSYVNSEFGKIGITAVKIHRNSFKLFWNPQLKGASQEIKGRTVKKVSSVSDRFTLLQPSITKMSVSKITWSVKIVKVSQWVGLGICFKDIVEKNNFDLVNYTNAEHGGFIISSNGYTWAHGNRDQNQCQIYGIPFKQGDTIEFEFNQKQSLLKYRNKTSNKTGQLNYQTKNINDDDSVYICSCLGGVEDQIEMGTVFMDEIELVWDQKKN